MKGKLLHDQEISPALSIHYPADHDSVTTFLIAVTLEWIGRIPERLLHWPWWIGAQLPIIYLMWKLAREQKFTFRVVEAWNERLKSG